jgi:IS30 family transposase
MKRLKRTFTTDERNFVFDLWKDGARFSDIGRVTEAKRVAKPPKIGVLQRYPELKQIVIDKLKLKWSPEKISGWLSVEYSRRKMMLVLLTMHC